MKYILYLSLLVFISCSLTRTVDVPEYNKNIQTNLQLADRKMKAIDADLESHQKIQEKWSDRSSKQKLSKITQTKQNITQYFYRLKEDIESSKFKDFRKITSKDKDYNEFMKQDSDFANRLDILNKQFENYRSESKNLNEYLATKKIIHVDPKKVSQDFMQALNESKKSQLSVKNELIDISVKSTPAQKKIIAELSKTVEQMENETFKLQRLYSASMKELSTGAKYVTPGMKTYDYESKLKAHEKAIQKLIENFHLKSQTIN